MVTRRRFLTTAGCAAAAAALPKFSWSQPPENQTPAPKERLRLAFIGVGGRGGSNLRELTSQGDEVVALCDVDQRHLDRAAAQFPSAKTFRDFRVLYNEFQDFDAVVVSTPEHTHAYATLPALRLGKHVYCEKPLTHNIVEARLVATAAKQAGVATQMGTQIHGMPNYRRVVELIQSGAIGPVREAHVWVSRAWGLQSEEEAKENKDIVYVAERPTEAMTPPDYLDWDLWLGPAPERPFHEVYFPGPKWYRWWEWGSGTMSDLGSHWNDLPFWALELDAPRRITADGPEPHPDLAPASMSVTYEYGPRGERPACQVHWYQGSHKPQIWTENGIPQWGNGVLFIGDDGMLLSDYSKHVLLPEEKFARFQPPEPFLRQSPGQHAEWLAACRTGSPTGSSFDYAAALTIANHLGNVAYRTGAAIEWDDAQGKTVGNAVAEAFLGRPNPRSGWSLG